MKRLVVSLIIILILGGLSCLGNLLTKNEYKKINESLNLVQEYIKKEDFESSKKIAEELEENWLKSEKKLAIFINHQLLEEVGLKLSVINPLCEKDSKTDCAAAIKEAKTALVHMKNGQIPSFETVM